MDFTVFVTLSPVLFWEGQPVYKSKKERENNSLMQVQLIPEKRSVVNMGTYEVWAG